MRPECFEQAISKTNFTFNMAVIVGNESNGGATIEIGRSDARRWVNADGFSVGIMLGALMMCILKHYGMP